MAARAVCLGAGGEGVEAVSPARRAMGGLVRRHQRALCVCRVMGAVLDARDVQNHVRLGAGCRVVVGSILINVHVRLMNATHPKNYSSAIP